MSISSFSNDVNKVNYNGESMSVDFNLGDIPDLSVIENTDRPSPFEDGWYQGTIMEKREFTDSNGNDRVFESGDAPAQTNGRNIRLQIELKRRQDGRTLNTSALVNYRPEDLTVATVQAIAARAAEQKTGGKEWGELFRPFMALTRLGKLQKIAGVRSFQRTTEGGLDLTPLYGKTAYFRIKPDDRNPAYKQIADYQDYEPKTKTVF